MTIPAVARLGPTKSSPLGAGWSPQPNILSIFDLGNEVGIATAVMELLDGDAPPAAGLNPMLR
jgi:hypothetical protein